MIKRDWTVILTGIASVIAIIGFMWGIMASFKSEIREDMGGLAARIDARMDAMDHRIFYLATGRNLDEVIKEEHLKANALTKS